jgi:2-keto-4-pentenoate hydratase
MTEDEYDQAGALLVACRDDGRKIEALPENLRPTTRDEGYAIQSRFELQSGGPLFGWKIAATSAAGQAHIAVDGPLAGRLLADRVIADGGICPLGANQMRVAELEFAFRMGQTLAPRAEPYSVDEAMQAVATLHPAIEIPDARFVSFEKAGAAQLIADNACANYFVLGSAAPEEWREIDLAAHRAVGQVNGGDPQPGVGSNVLGDPRVALQWLANELSQLGVSLAAGHVVTTGTCLKPMAIAPGDHVRGDFGVLGIVSVEMASA